MGKDDNRSRREFLKKIIATSVVAGLSSYVKPAELLAAMTAGKMPMRPLGKTGHMVGIYSLGGQATIETIGKEKEAEVLINKAIDLGINYIDTAAAYGRPTKTITKKEAMGTSEKNIGRVMKYRRNEVFLASKTHDRTYDGSMRLLEKTLKNLQTDHLDLWQVHNIKKRERDQLKTFLGSNGVIKAMEKAKSEGMVRFIGCTGHEDPDTLKDFINMYPFDNILMAVNAADKHYNSFIERLLPVAVEKKMGIVGMKIPARDRIFDHGGIITMKEAMDYVMTLPVSTIIIGLDKVSELEENIKKAREFKPLTADEMLAIEDKTKPYFKDLMFFKGLSKWPPE
jgi:aryl-alcohol dehydrogenase-like predicted oxidoreductase